MAQQERLRKRSLHTPRQEIELGRNNDSPNIRYFWTFFIIFETERYHKRTDTFEIDADRYNKEIYPRRETTAIILRSYKNFETRKDTSDYNLTVFELLNSKRKKDYETDFLINFLGFEKQNYDKPSYLRTIVPKLLYFLQDVNKLRSILFCKTVVWYHDFSETTITCQHR